jgi:membrane glycosyltransferase
MRAMLAWTLFAVEAGVWLLLVAASLHLLKLALWGLWQPRLADEPAPPIPDDPPLVTVQLPMRNERDVAARLIRAVAALDWPRLQVQVLDDSDDETRGLVDSVAAELRAGGADVTVIRRADRRGWKAGNLQNALAAARGDYLLVLDADSQPSPDLVRRLIAPLRADERLAFVQARWSFANETESLTTRAQAIILHALFTVEQARLTAAKKPLQFNGTAGMWRTSALRDAGGWHTGDPSVTEDLDLGYRVRLRGLRGATLPAIAVGTELPSTMSDFRTQQMRWVRGAGEVLRGLGRRLMTGSLSDGVSMLAHLLRHARQPLLLALALLLPVAALGWIAPPHASWATAPPGYSPEDSASLAGWLATASLRSCTWSVVLMLTLLAVAAYHAAALRRLGRSPAMALITAPLVAALSVGLSFSLSTALLGGLFGGTGEFVRTPKRGDAATSSYRAARPLRPVELVLGLVHAAAAVFLAMHGDWPAVLALAFFFAFGFLWVGAG